MLFSFKDCLRGDIFLCLFFGVFIAYVILFLLDTGKQFEVITSSSADVYKQEQVHSFFALQLCDDSYNYHCTFCCFFIRDVIEIWKVMLCF